MFIITTIYLSLLLNFANSLSDHPILIVVSYDAFRYNFFDKNANPYMLQLREKGTYAEYLNNVFPTKTFPNHHSIATGLYPQKHGVVGNSFYDPAKKRILTYGYDMFHYDEDVIPLWRRNEMSGSDRYSGSMMWPGGQYPYQDSNITYFQEYNQSINWHIRIDKAISWIEDPVRPANLVMVYFEEPDTHGHAFGPDSKTVFHFLQLLDNITFYLEQQLELKGLTNKVNIVYLSDHGLIGVTPPHFINVTQYLKSNTYKLAGSSPVLHVIPKEGFQNETYSILKNLSKKTGNFKVYLKHEMLDRWKFKNNPRAPPVLLLANEGYGFQDLAENAKLYAKIYNFTVTNTSQFGVHGYDNVIPDMHPFFMAHGPKIKVNYKVEPFNTVDLFGLFCKILEIPSTDNDGSSENTKDILIIDPTNTSLLPIIVVIVGAILLVLLLILCAAVVTLLIIKRQQNITTAAALNKRFPQNFSHSKIEVKHLLEPEDA